MTDQGHRSRQDRKVTRRKFIAAGSAAFVGGGLVLPAGRALGMVQGPEIPPIEAPGEEPQVEMQHRTLGRTGFQVSDIGMGCGRIEGPNVVRYAYDHGVNYFDTAWIYGNGDSETKIGQAMQFLDRRRIFLTTKLPVEAGTTEQELRDRFAQSLERLKTGYVDGLMMHGIADVSLLGSEPFHKVATEWKAAGKVRHLGVSSHGPSGDEPDSMERVFGAAAEDGRFDLFLIAFNFMNREEGERVLAACKDKDIGTTGMKMAPGVLKVDPFDPENPTGRYARFMDSLLGRGLSREDAVARIRGWIAEQEEARAKTGPFMEQYGITGERELDLKSVQWVLGHPGMHTVCISMPDFDTLDAYLPLTGTRLSRAGRTFLRDYEHAYGDQYCRHACSRCRGSCPYGLPVSTIMRYSYYYARQGRQKYAMGKYARLAGRDGSLCLTCAAPCKGACPHGVNIQAQLLNAHSLLQFA